MCANEPPAVATRILNELQEQAIPFNCHKNRAILNTLSQKTQPDEHLKTTINELLTLHMEELQQLGKSYKDGTLPTFLLLKYTEHYALTEVRRLTKRLQKGLDIPRRNQLLDDLTFRKTQLKAATIGLGLPPALHEAITNQDKFYKLITT